MIRFYLAGSIQFTESYMDWRIDMTKFLEANGFGAYNPLTKYSGKSEQYKDRVKKFLAANQIDLCRNFTRTIIIAPDYNYIDKSDGLIVYIKKEDRVFGTIAEMSYAYRTGKPIFLVTDIPVIEYSAWMVGMSTKIFRNFTELKRYLKKALVMR